MDSIGSMQVLRHLDEMSAEYEILQCEPQFADTAAFCEHYGYSAQQSANAILVASKNEPKEYALCLLLADARLDVNHAVRREMGVKKLSFATAEETTAKTGMLIGGVTPFGVVPGVAILIDSRVMQQPWVIVGGGDRSTKIKLAPTFLAALPNAKVVKGLALS